MTKYVVGLMLSFLFLPLCVHASGGGTAWGQITEAYINQGWTMVRVNGVSDNPDSCPSTAYYALSPDDPNYQALHSTLMTAQIAGRDVRFWVYQCGGQSMTYPHIISVWVR